MYGVILCVEYRSDIICSADVRYWLQALLMLRWPATVTWSQLPHFTAEQASTLCATTIFRPIIHLEMHIYV